jgi:ribosomal protein L7Ae-like RNA K-turn-binding protein
LAQKVTVVSGSTMEELGVACGIDVGAAAIAILK